MSGLGAIVLAAGEGSRFGGPKALAVSEDRPWIGIALSMLREAGLEEIVVVIGARPEEVRRLLPAEVLVVENPDWRKGRTGSIQRGLGALSSIRRGALVHQVDFPEVQSATVRRLCRACAEHGTAEQAVFLPTCDGRRGHPVALGRDVWPEVYGLDPDEPLRVVIRRDPARVVLVPVDDPGIHRNRNTAPEEES